MLFTALSMKPACATNILSKKWSSLQNTEILLFYIFVSKILIDSSKFYSSSTILSSINVEFDFLTVFLSQRIYFFGV